MLHKAYKEFYLGCINLSVNKTQGEILFTVLFILISTKSGRIMNESS